MSPSRQGALGWLLLSVCMGVPAAGATGARCPFRNGNLPVIATSFEVGGTLRAKLRMPDAFEKKAAAKLADELQCVNAVRFLDWKPLEEAGVGRAGIFQASMERKGELPNVWIELRLSYSLEGGARYELTRLPANLAVIYPSKEPQAPGIDGRNWLSQLERRFSELAGDPGFQAILTERFMAVTLTRRDVRENPDLQRVELPLLRYDLEADETGTVLSLAVQPKSGRLLKELTLHPTCVPGVDSLLGEIVPTPWSEASRILGDRKATALSLKSYKPGYRGTCFKFEGPRR